MIENKKNENLGKYFGSYDEFFLDNNTPANKNNNNIFKNEKIKLNILHKKEKVLNNNFNIYNIVKNDKIIQNNFYEFNNNKKISIKNPKLIIETRNYL